MQITEIPFPDHELFDRGALDLVLRQRLEISKVRFFEDENGRVMLRVRGNVTAEQLTAVIGNIRETIDVMKNIKETKMEENKILEEPDDDFVSFFSRGARTLQKKLEAEAQKNIDSMRETCEKTEAEAKAKLASLDTVINEKFAAMNDRLIAIDKTQTEILSRIAAQQKGADARTARIEATLSLPPLPHTERPPCLAGAAATMDRLQKIEASIAAINNARKKAGEKLAETSVAICEG